MTRKWLSRHKDGKHFLAGAKEELPKLQNLPQLKREPTTSLQEEIVLRCAKAGTPVSEMLRELNRKFEGRFTQEGIIKILQRLEERGKIKVR